MEPGYHIYCNGEIRVRRTENRVSIINRDKMFLFSPQSSEWLWAHIASYPMGTGDAFLGGKAAG